MNPDSAPSSPLAACLAVGADARAPQNNTSPPPGSTGSDPHSLARRFQTGTLLVLLLGTLLGLVVRTEDLAPSPTLMMPGPFYRLLSLHGLLLVFWFYLPAVPAGLGTMRIPELLGVSGLRLPGAARAGYWLWLGGIGCLAVSCLLGAPDGGLLLRPPLSTTGSWAPAVAALAVACAATSSTLVALSLLATVLCARPRAESFFDWPILVVALSCSAAVSLLVLPVLATTMLLVFLGRAIGLTTFLSGPGLDLHAHLVWASLRPACVVSLLGAVGVVADRWPEIAGRQLGLPRVLSSSVLVAAVLSLSGWGVHLLTSGQSVVVAALFSAFALLLALPLGAMTVSLIGSLRGIRLAFEAPLVYALGLVWFLMVGLLSGAIASVISINLYLHATTFVVAHFHALALGATTSGSLAGLLLSRQKSLEPFGHTHRARLAALLLVAGINLAVLADLVAGVQGLPRAAYEYPQVFWGSRLLAFLGCGVVFLALGITCSCLWPFRPWRHRQALR